MTTPVRWRLEGRLTTRSPLHVGSGETTVRPGLVVEEKDGERPAEVAAIAVDHEGRAYLPGSAVKGALRSWIREHVPGSEESVGSLFGDEDTRPLEERRKTGTVSRGGKAEFWDARQPGEPALSHPPPHWDPTRATGVRAFVTLDRRTKTVAGERLFHEEFVPPGVGFDLVITGQCWTDDEVDLILAALEHGFAEDAAEPLALGAGSANGDGRFTFELTALRRLAPDGVAAWLAKAENAGYEGLPIVPVFLARSVAARQKWAPSWRDRMHLKLELTFDSPFAVGSAFREPAAAGEDRKGARLPACDELGRPVIPGSSIRGALRGQAEKILRTLGIQACDPGSASACKPIQAMKDVDDLCPACRLFGAAGWGTAVDVTDFRVVGQAPEPHSQEHLAIDRFTGGVAGSRKFKSESFQPATLAGSITLDRKRTEKEPWAEGLLALVLRDLVEGDVPLGHGAARGFGAVQARLTEPAGGLGALEAERAAFQAQLDELRKNPAQPVTLVAAALPAQAAPPPAHPANRPKPGANEFHNPYHFVPLPAKTAQDPEALPVTKFTKGDLGALTHDRYVPGTFSGRITFQVKTETPTVLGGTQVPPANPQGSATVQPFELDGEPAIPGSSLRGLLSSLVEAVTGSALRVLEDTSFSVRCQMKDSLPALGRLVDDQGILKLEPLALPHFSWKPKEGQPSSSSEVSRWHDLFPQGPVLKAYIAGSLRTKLLSASSEEAETWWLKLGDPPRWPPAPNFGLDPARLHVKETTKVRNGVPTTSYSLVAQRPLDRLPPLTTDQLNEKLDPLDPERSKYVPGILRILDFAGHDTEIPTGRKHEIFIPTPARPPGAKPYLLDIDGPLADFHRLAAERARPQNSYLPFSPKGGPRINGTTVKLRAGDVVWFQIDPRGQVERLALSSIWRRGKGTAFDYFADHRELLPFHPDREAIDTAERLFGFVEEGEIPKKRSARALASRVRVANGRLNRSVSGAEPWYVCPAPRALAILGSPKPPSPALYFRDPQSRSAILKRALDQTRHEPQGRKFYLHRRGGNWFYRPGPGSDDKQQLRVLARPLRSGLVFESHLDFDNLTEREVALLAYALRPTAEFRHKLGLGKPLGLGTVEITPLQLETVDRQQRYEADALTAPRHAAEKADLDSLRGRLRAELDAELRDALELLGDPAAVVAPVHYPLTPEQKDNAQDEEHFRWFVRNEGDSYPQALAPIGETEIRERVLPRLNRGPVAAPPPAAPANPALPGQSTPTSSGFATLGDQLKHLKLKVP